MTLDSRKGRILQAIVDDYVDTAEPIGSEWLVTHYDFGCKSATLRNEMAEMAELGYLVQPHTSAGRVPSNRGYRYYVDCLMVPALPEASRRRSLGASRNADLEAEEIVQLTCRMLADMTQYPSVATSPAVSSARLHHVYVTPAGAHHALIVMLLSIGQVEHRLLDLGAPVSDAALQRITNYLNQAVGGRPLTEVAASGLGVIPTELAAERALLEKIHARIVESAGALTEDRVFLEGANHILRQPEFQDVLRLEQLLAALEQRSALYPVLSRALLGEDVTVLIGDESPVSAMRECSIVSTQYRIGDRVGGVIGVVGPTRMHYDRAVATVGLMARNLSSLLTRASFE